MLSYVVSKALVHLRGNDVELDSLPASVFEDGRISGRFRDREASQFK